MPKQFSYVIVAAGPSGGRRPPAFRGRRPPAFRGRRPPAFRGRRPPAFRGRHRLGAPGTTPRYPAGPPRQPGRRRACHRRTTRPSAYAVRYAMLLMLFGAIAVSGWFTASGATAVAQMIQP